MDSGPPSTRRQMFDPTESSAARPTATSLRSSDVRRGTCSVSESLPCTWTAFLRVPVRYFSIQKPGTWFESFLTKSIICTAIRIRNWKLGPSLFIEAFSEDIVWLVLLSIGLQRIHLNWNGIDNFSEIPRESLGISVFCERIGEIKA